jgi:cell volume regulation protein A
MIERNGVYLRPGGSTVIEANDLLMVLADDAKDFDLVKECLISDTSD